MYDKVSAVFIQSFDCKAMYLWSKRRVLILCSCVPVLMIAAFSWTAISVRRNQDVYGDWFCSSKDKGLEKSGLLLWDALYMFVPGALLLGLSIAIGIKINKQRDDLTESHSQSFYDSR